MKTTITIGAAAAALALALAAAGCGNGADRKVAEQPPASGAHGDEEDVVLLSAEAMRIAGIGIAEIGRVSIGHTIEMPGEIAYNEERRIHITPRYAGVIRDVRARLGDSVREGETLAIVESNTSLTSYEIAAPIAGRVVEMHATLGEFVGEDRDLFVVADLSTVWANCDVFVEDLRHVRIGQSITIAAVGSEETIRGTVSYISSALNEKTRAASVRAVIPGNGVWRPGVFIRATLRIPGGEAVPAVAREAVQLLGDTQVIFVEGDTPGEFRPVPVKTGRSDETRVELLEGPPPGTKYVSSGAFDLKAQIVIRESGSHAGHGH